MASAGGILITIIAILLAKRSYDPSSTSSQSPSPSLSSPSRNQGSCSSCYDQPWRFM